MQARREPPFWARLAGRNFNGTSLCARRAVGVCVGVCLRVCVAQRVANGPMFSHRYIAPCSQALRDSGEPVASTALSQRARDGLVFSPGLDEGWPCTQCHCFLQNMTHHETLTQEWGPKRGAQIYEGGIAAESSRLRRTRSASVLSISLSPRDTQTPLCDKRFTCNTNEEVAQAFCQHG